MVLVRLSCCYCCAEPNKTKFYREKIAQQGNELVCGSLKDNPPPRLPVVMAYKHLGTWVHNDSKPLHAIRDRITAARKAWGPLVRLVRPIFSKKNVAFDTKIQVFNALVMSRFMFNAHTSAWAPDDALDTWEASSPSWATSICLVQWDLVWTLQYTLPPRNHLHLARLRYFKHFITFCPAVLWDGHVGVAFATVTGMVGSCQLALGCLDYLCLLGHPMERSLDPCAQIVP